MVDGMVPDNWFPEIYTEDSMVRLPMVAGMVPFN